MLHSAVGLFPPLRWISSCLISDFIKMATKERQKAALTLIHFRLLNLIEFGLHVVDPQEEETHHAVNSSSQSFILKQCEG